ncbi:MAG: gluconate 2-dehydrogenase subunit 3 family protein [Bacteroidia bacterium]|nr:gluconate 2-dehydrogenase subunit 3 family protein [Bacteroidia bacterium]
MDRRETLKSLLIGSLAAGTILHNGCRSDQRSADAVVDYSKLYGRTPEELELDRALMAQESIFTVHELETIAILCDIILPATNTAGSAAEAEVPAFIDFIVKDMPNHQLALKGGLMWLDTESNRRYGKVFSTLDDREQISIIDGIAYPDRARPEMKPGVRFFNKMRDLTLTGYYTSKMGIDDLGYKGNRPNAWDGVPAEVLKDYSVDYDPEWLAKCVDQDKRNDIAEWDEKGNLLS